VSEVNRLAKEFLSLCSGKSKKKEEAVVPHNSFRGLFDLQEPPEEEVRQVEELFGMQLKGGEDEEAVRCDFRDLVQLTSELKAIQKQAILLIGERVFQVREIFLKYGEEKGGFTRWLEYAFNTRKTAYNALSFYELYQSLPTEDLKNNLNNMQRVFQDRHSQDQVQIQRSKSAGNLARHI